MPLILSATNVVASYEVLVSCAVEVNKGGGHYLRKRCKSVVKMVFLDVTMCVGLCLCACLQTHSSCQSTRAAPGPAPV